MPKPYAARLTFKKSALKVSEQSVRFPADAQSIASERIGNEPQEHFEAIYLSQSNEVVAVHEVAIGGIGQCSVDPRVLFSGALLAGAVGIILCHNHPSGNVEPSADDIALTSTLMRGAKLLGLSILDHVIVGRGGKAHSMREHGSFPRL